MSDVPVFYATTDGHTRRIADRLVARLRSRGLSSDAVDVATDAVDQVTWAELRGAVVCASLRMGRHQRAAQELVTAHRDELAAVPSLFVSVSCSAASKNPGEREAARDIAARFLVESRWTPRGPTDTTRDHDLTDWLAVDRLADDLADQMLAGTSPRPRGRHLRV